MLSFDDPYMMHAIGCLVTHFLVEVGQLSSSSSSTNFIATQVLQKLQGSGVNKVVICDDHRGSTGPAEYFPEQLASQYGRQ